MARGGAVGHEVQVFDSRFSGGRGAGGVAADPVARSAAARRSRPADDQHPAPSSSARRYADSFGHASGTFLRPGHLRVGPRDDARSHPYAARPHAGRPRLRPGRLRTGPLAHAIRHRPAADRRPDPHAARAAFA